MATPAVLPSAQSDSVGAPVHCFQGSIFSLHVPLSTLRLRPYDPNRMTRGQDGSLLLSCVTLSFTTRRRFVPAHQIPNLPPHDVVSIQLSTSLAHRATPAD
jgi:hypothetical protein